MVAGVITFGTWLPVRADRYQVSFILFPFAIWAALRFGQRGATLASFAVVGMAVWGILWAAGPPRGPSVHAQLANLYTLEIAIVLSSMLAGAAVSERDRAQLVTQRLAAIVRSSEDAIVGKTLDGIIVNWNEGAERLYGYRAEEVIGRPMAMMVPPKRTGELERLLAQIGEGRRVEQFETLRLTKSGARVDVSLTISPIRAPDGQIVGASSIARDITGRLRAEEERREVLTALTKAMPGISRLDAAGRYEYVNESYSQMLCCRPEELLGRSSWARSTICGT